MGSHFEHFLRVLISFLFFSHARVYVHSFCVQGCSISVCKSYYRGVLIVLQFFDGISVRCLSSSHQTLFINGEYNFLFCSKILPFLRSLFYVVRISCLSLFKILLSRQILYYYLASWVSRSVALISCGIICYYTTPYNIICYRTLPARDATSFSRTAAPPCVHHRRSFNFIRVGTILYHNILFCFISSASLILNLYLIVHSITH